MKNIPPPLYNKKEENAQKFGINWRCSVPKDQGSKNIKIAIELALSSAFYISFLFPKILFILEKDGEHEQGEGERESQADSLLSTEPNVGPDPRTTRL